MADNDFQHLPALSKAFSGLGIEENTLVSILGKSRPEHRTLFRKSSFHFLVEDERSFERWNDQSVKLLKHEFMRFKNALVFWTMHPWERDARLVKEALQKGPQSYGVIVEIACTRSSDELLGARKAYHSLFDHSIEEDVATQVQGSERKLLVALVSAYRYEGPKVRDDSVKSEAKHLADAIKNGGKKNPIEDEEVVRILSTRSKPHLCQIYKQYNEYSGSNITEDLNAANLFLKETVECLCVPQIYFSKILDESMKSNADKNSKKGLTRVVVTRADVDMKETREEYSRLYGVSLSEKVEATANGNYKDLLLTLINKD